MTTQKPSTDATPNKVQQAEAAFRQLLVDASRRGFHGTASLTLSLQDGHIQHLRVSVDQMLKVQ